MRFFLRLTAGLKILATCGTAQSGTVETFRMGNWSGNAYTDDKSGLFSICVDFTPYRSGITLHVQVDSSYYLAIGFSAPHWDMKVRENIPLQYRIDRAAWQHGTAKAASKSLTRMQMPENGYILTRFRRGRTMYVYDGIVSLRVPPDRHLAAVLVKAGLPSLANLKPLPIPNSLSNRRRPCST